MDNVPKPYKVVLTVEFRCNAWGKTEAAAVEDASGILNRMIERYNYTLSLPCEDSSAATVTNATAVQIGGHA